MRRPTARVQTVAIDGTTTRTRPDRVVTEEPLEIRVKGPGEEPVPVAVTLRTPGHDFELAVGFCVAEGLLTAPADLATVEYCLGGQGEQEYNVVTISRRAPVGDAVRRRSFSATASCGLCGKATIDDLHTRCDPITVTQPWPWATVRGALDRLAESQATFAATGGLHAAALVDRSGRLLVAREDVGRHNALDQVIGHRFLAEHWPAHDTVVALSGRVGFELVQKAAVAGIGIVVAVGAPTSLAIDTARQLGITIVGFARGERANVYTHPDRIVVAGATDDAG